MRLVVLVAVLAAIGAWIAFDDGGAPLPQLVGGATPRNAPAGEERGTAPARPANISARATLEELRADPFQPQSWMPPVKVNAEAAPAPVAPPLPYRFAGRLYDGSGLQVFLGKGDAVLAAKQGDTLEGQYRVESLRDDEINLVYLPMGTKYRIQFSPLLNPVEGIAASVPATGVPVAPATSPPRAHFPAGGFSGSGAGAAPGAASGAAAGAAPGSAAGPATTPGV